MEHVRLQVLLRQRTQRAAGLVAMIGPPIVAALGVGLGYGGARLLGYEGALPVVAGALLGLMAAVWAGLRAQKRGLERVLAEQGWFLRPFEFSADGAGVTVKTSVSHTFVAWAGIVDIESSDPFIMFWLDGASALALPARALADRGPAAVVLQDLRALKQRAEASQ
jgi:hypothetical protein